MKTITAQEIAIQFVEDIPGEYISRITELLQKEVVFDAPRILYLLQATIPQIDVQEKIRSFVDKWHKVSGALSPREMALTISAIDAALEYQGQKQAIELTWTGPKTGRFNLRRNDQALIELISSASQRITIISFAVYKAKNILDALEKAAKRNVVINIILESPDSGEGKIAYDSISHLDFALKSMAKIFIWPYSKRLMTSDGRFGSLHAKVAISDSEKLYVSSANLTDYAMNLNMEMGVLITGGDLPARTQIHFDELISNGILAEVANH